MKTTKHNNTCKMAFGRPSKHNTCPRCEELKNGAAPVKGWNYLKKQQEEQRREAIKNHCCKTSNCGPICTAFEW